MQWTYKVSQSADRVSWMIHFTREDGGDYRLDRGPYASEADATRMAEFMTPLIPITIAKLYGA